MNIFRKSFIILIGVLIFTDVSRAGSSEFESLKKYFKNISIYKKMCTQEKVYLHLDNNGYFPGETMWFKAYVFGAATLLPTDLSRVLYVELVTPEGEVLQRKKYPILNGRTCGEFLLEDIIHTGFYEVRAYTRAMLNWDNAYTFSRVIPIFDAPTDSLIYPEVTMTDCKSERDKAIRRPLPSPLIENTTQKEHNVYLTFYPEGGELTRGIASKVAFKVIAPLNKPVDNLIRIYNNNKELVDSTYIVHEGMGCFNLPDNWEGGYATLTSHSGKKLKYNIPIARLEGCNISTEIDEDGNLIVNTSSSSGFPSQTLGLSVTCRGAACFFDTIRIEPSSSIETEVPINKLRDGIQQVTLFTSDGNILSERLVWIPSRQNPLQFTISKNAESYNPFSPIVLEFNLKDENSKPIQGEFSLSVRDADGELAADGADIDVEMLLCSDLKGYIHKPEYYFEKDDDEHNEALDLLMMVQGWRRYEWKEMARVTPFVLKQPAEDGLLVDGKIIGRKQRPKEGVKIDLAVLRDGKFIEGNTMSDSTGKFALMLPFFYGNGTAVFTTTNDENKRISCNVALNRGFSPDPTPYDPQSLIIDRPKVEDIKINAKEELFQWTDTLSYAIHLPEAAVKAKQKLHPYGSRFTWMGGEGAGKKIATLYYNVEDALEKLLDQGKDELDIWTWLANVNPNLVVEVPDEKVESILTNDVNQYGNTIAPRINNIPPLHKNPTLTYKGKPVVLFIDNDQPLGSRVGDTDINYLMSEIRSVVICESTYAYSKFISGSEIKNNYSPSETNGREFVAFFLYSRIDNNLVKSKKGQRITVVHGYSKYEEFFSPRYCDVDVPTPSDVRRTLYWNPNIITDKDGKANVLFFSNCRKNQHIKINAQGIAVNGQMFTNPK